MDNLKKYILPLLVLSLLASLIVFFRTFLMTSVIEPIALVCWAVWRAASSVNQNIYWIVLIAICLISILRLIPFEDDNQPTSPYDYKYKSPDRIEYWQTMIKDAIWGREETEYLRDSLKKLFISVIAQAERSDPTELEDIIATGKLPLSMVARRFLLPPKGMMGAFSTNHRLNILFIVPRWIRRWAGKFIHPDNTSIDEVLKWMEATLEMDHDK